MKKYSILGVRVDAVTLQEITAEIDSKIAAGSPSLFTSLGSLTVMEARNNSAFKEVIEKSALVICDGAGIVKALRFQEGLKLEKYSGIDLIPVFAELSVKKGYRLFLVGSKDDVITVAVDNIKKVYPGVNICGFANGYFDIMNDEIIRASIKAAKPDILLAGLGQPRQEIWLARVLKELSIPVGMGVGGSFDVISGRLNRAPASFRKAGLEWLYRMLKEPWRFKRNMALSHFIMLIIKNKFSGGKIKW